jgi:hypothetical protein
MHATESSCCDVDVRWCSDGVEKLSALCAAFLEEGIRVDNAAQLFQTGPQLVLAPFTSPCPALPCAAVAHALCGVVIGRRP